MTDVLTCPACEAQYVGARLACIDCGIPLVDGPRLAPGEDEVGYALADWGDGERHQLATALAGEGIASRWEQVELVVKEADADRVEELIDEIDNPDALDAEDEGDDADGGAEVLSTLYVAADVLHRDPGSAVAIVELLEASERASELGAPYGLDGDVWREVQARSDALADLLGAEAEEEQVMAAAKALRDAVHPLV
jgi:hypothetical protein